MTAVCTTPPIRPTFDICPHWCAGHEGNYQSWDLNADGGRTRHHAEEGVSIGGVFVAVMVEEDGRHGLGIPGVQVGDNSPGMRGSSDLNDSDAHELGLAIVRAADTARRFRFKQEAGR